jgi:hypothetical protein
MASGIRPRTRIATGDGSPRRSTVTALAPRFLAILAPYQVDAEAESAEAPLLVEALDLGEGVAAWLVTSSEGTDLVLLRETDAAESFSLDGDIEISTDGELIIVSLDDEERFCLLVRGSVLSVNDNECASLDEVMPFVVVE